MYKFFDTGFKTDSTTEAADRTALTVDAPQLESNSSIAFSIAATKIWNNPGVEASYTFTVMLDTALEISYGPGLWLLVEFPR